MPCGAKGTCEHAYRKPGKDTLHCDIQTAQGGRWDFCAHQYLCTNSRRYELSKEATDCPLPNKEPAIEAAEETAKAEEAVADEPVEKPKTKKTAKKKEAVKNGD